MSAFNFILALVLLPETRRPGSETRPRPLSPAAFLAVARHPVVGLCVVLTFVLTVAFSIMESTFGLFSEHVHGLDVKTVGRMFAVAGGVMILVQGGAIRPLVKRFGEARLVPVGVALLAIGLALLPYAPPFWPMVGVFVLMAMGQGVASPSLQALVSRGTSEEEQGFVLGTNQSMSALARAVGPSVAGLLYAGLSPAAPFLVSAAILAASTALAAAAVRRWRRGTLAAPPP